VRFGFFFSNAIALRPTWRGQIGPEAVANTDTSDILLCRKRPQHGATSTRFLA